MEEEIYKLGYS